MADIDRFWRLIDDARKQSSEAGIPLFDSLVSEVSQLSENRIVDFYGAFEEAISRAYREDLWAVAYLVNGGCSDDGFDYFLGWLISNGREYFEAALGNPVRAADAAAPGDEVFFEEMWVVAPRAYESKTGRSDFYDRLPRSPGRGELQGEAWDEEDLPSMFPDLAKKFGY